MASPKKIVVAVDEGEESMHALSWCLKNVVPESSSADGSSKQDTTLVLLHAKPPPVVYPSIDAAGAFPLPGYVFSADLVAAMDKYGSDAADHIIEKAKNACSGLGGNVKVETRVASGDPRDVICEAVEREGADTLVMGSHGYGPFKRAFFGSVSSHCAQNVKCPVLIVKRPTST